jgi:glycosyltransferase involved in cell wall biosynthesis
VDELRTPAVSVVIPTHGRPDLLPRTIASIAAQDLDALVECIIVHDAPEVTERFAGDARPDLAIRELANARIPGLAGARNTGILAARAPLVAFCDDDDTWDARKLRLQMRALEETGALVASCSNVVTYGRHRTVRRAPGATVAFADLVRDRVAVLHSSTILARRDAIIERIGLIDEAIPRGASEDYEWQLRASRIAPIVVVDEPLVDVAWHEGSRYSRRWDLYVGGLEYILREYPEFDGCPRGKARVQGQIAFGYAAMGLRRTACRWATACVRHDWRQPRGYLALMVAAGLLPTESLLSRLNAHGRGV